MFYNKSGGVILIMYSTLSQIQATKPAYFACESIKNESTFIHERSVEVLSQKDIKYKFTL